MTLHACRCVGERLRAHTELEAVVIEPGYYALPGGNVPLQNKAVTAVA